MHLKTLKIPGNAKYIMFIIENVSYFKVTEEENV